MKRIFFIGLCALLLILPIVIAQENSTNTTMNYTENQTINITVPVDNSTDEVNDTVEINATVADNATIQNETVNETIEIVEEVVPIEEPEEENEVVIEDIGEEAPVEEEPVEEQTAVEPEPVKEIIREKTVIIREVNNNTDAPIAAQGTNWDMIGAIVGVIAIIGALFGWWLSKRQKSKTSKFLRRINETYERYKSDKSNCEVKLYELKRNIEKEFTKEKLDQDAFDFLDNRIEKHLKEVRVGMVDKLEVSNNTKKEVEQMLDDGIITEEEYAQFMKRKQMSDSDLEKLNGYMKKWRDEKK